MYSDGVYAFRKELCLPDWAGVQTKVRHSRIVIRQENVKLFGGVFGGHGDPLYDVRQEANHIWRVTSTRFARSGQQRQGAALCIPFGYCLHPIVRTNGRLLLFARSFCHVTAASVKLGPNLGYSWRCIPDSSEGRRAFSNPSRLLTSVPAV